jgi:hypothetical protein
MLVLSVGDDRQKESAMFSIVARIRRLIATHTQPVRWIGPIPEMYRDETAPDDPWAHPGGPAPAWGGYSPVPVELTAEEWEAADADALARVRLWRAQTSPTRLLRTEREEWYVEAPRRHSRRCVEIAIRAIWDGRDEREILALGISRSEIDAARRECAVRETTVNAYIALIKAGAVS